MLGASQRALGAVLVASLGVLVIAVARCSGGDDDPIGTADAGPDRKRPDASAADASIDASAIDSDASCTPDGGVSHDYPGYTRVDAIDRCCQIDVPDDLVASAPQWGWEPCKSGRPSCDEFKVSWTNPDSSRHFAYARRFGSAAPVLEMAIWRGTGQVDDLVYDMTSGAPLKSRRVNQLSGCLVCSPSTSSEVIPIAFVRREAFRLGREARDSGPMLDATYETIPSPVVVPLAENISAYAISDSVLALEVGPPGSIVLGPIGGPFVRTPPNQILQTPFVFGNLVIAINEHGNAGFSRAYKVELNGTVTSYISKPATHIYGVTTDGSRIYWVEASGDPNYTVPPTVCELWSSPYSEDATVLAQGATKLANLPYCVFTAQTLVYDGLVAVWEGKEIVVVRTSDGATRNVDLTTGRSFEQLVNVTPTEVWAIEGGPKMQSVAFVRIRYPGW
jgi:hypothetical protein